MGEFADDAVAASLDTYWDGDDGEGEDYLEIGLRRKRGERNYQWGVPHHHWRVADGSVVAMEDMTTEHIRNALNVCIEVDHPQKAAEFRYVLDQRRRKGIQVPTGTVTNNLFGLPITVA